MTKGNLLLVLIKLLRRAGKLSFEEFVFMAGHHAMGIHDQKIQEGTYDKYLKPISDRIDAIEKQAGLKEGQYWPRKQGPPEWQELNRKYEAVCDRLLVREMRGLKLGMLADLFRNERGAFDAAFEQGRRARFHKNDVRNAVAQLVSQYEAEARRSELGRAYYGAIVMYGSACEACLLLRILDSPADAEAARLRLCKDKRPGADPMKWVLDQLISVAVEAGWLSQPDGEAFEFQLKRWAQTLRLLRNLVHPGKHALIHPHVAIGDTQVHHARAIYTVISKSIDAGRINPGSRKGTRTAAAEAPRQYRPS